MRKKHLAYLENLANDWQKKAEAEKENIKKQEEEKNKQEQKKTQTEENKSQKIQEELEHQEKEQLNKLTEEEKEGLEEEKEDNPQVPSLSPSPISPPLEELTPQMLEKWKSQKGSNDKEKAEILLNSFKDDKEFLKYSKDKVGSKDLNLLTQKLPKLIIVLVKRFEYDKDKKIREYYSLKSHEKLTDEQINQYLYLEASEELIIKENKVENQVVSSSINMTKVLKFLAPMGFFSYFSLLLSFCIVELRRERLEFEKVKFTIRKSSQQNILLNF